MRARQLDRYFSGFALGLFVAGTMMLPGVQAKSQSESAVKPGVISGRVFLITQAGDIKPARMAHVLLFYDSDPSVATAENDKNSVGHEWRVEYLKALIAYNAEREKVMRALEDAQRQSKSGDKHERREAAKNLPIAEANLHAQVASSCSDHLLLYNSALSATLKWEIANAQEKSWQLISEQADEDGHFKIAVPRPGKYVVIVTGRAGFNEAVWKTEDPVTISPGEETTIKMGSPAHSCLATE